MKFPKSLFFLLVFFIVSCDNPPQPIEDSRENDYALFDEQGAFHRLSSYNDNTGIVLWIQGNGCPIVRNLLLDFHTIEAEYSEKGFKFFMLNSNIQDNRASIKKEASEFNFKVPVLDDSAQLLADELDITITAEAIVLDPVSREILYRGPLNDRLDYEAQKSTASEHYLKKALDEILTGKSPQLKQKMTKGCRVTRLSSLEDNEDLTYTEDIAPILKQNCVRCHHDDGLAPWSMSDYQTIVGWSSMIKEVILSKRMPPWQADPHIGEFKNSVALSDSNARKLLQWIDNGLKPGTGDDLLANLEMDNKEWPKGIPDQILTLNTESIPATGIIGYRYQEIPLKLTKGTWLKGVVIKPGNTKVLHHVVLTNEARNKTSPITNRKQRPWQDNYIALSAGAELSTFYPDSTGVFLPKGTVLTAQIHYTPSGREETDQSTIGLYFHEDPPPKEFYALSPANMNFTIPPFGENIKITASDTINRDIYIHYVIPHMHYRGKDIRVSIVEPDGKNKVLVSVPDYNFNWQWLYKLKVPTFVPKGSIILVEGIYDNTYQNPLNPDPTQEVNWGLQSTDEMLIGFFNFTLAN
ncbi:redoxin domain-containing protein [Constantimarinum furrinae]|uniref:Alkyl hydroperoxide reductase subunit C/ Thiol specific antioxidant domain-containing protein n=1 Tax=Constantimarinum furrinae TaxID=2562285 RepID=A0A7G8PXZ1_9FLAO|nr:redoxin domain-containing protein [Constantimarinum furrinae]QNJ99207.1 hypothetical protein ALE3EI_2680 [Constantimarinum furrinae]